MDKLKMHSPNLTEDNIVRIRDLFPGCVTEARGDDGSVKLAVDFDQLRQELSSSIVEGPQERYHLNWPGKREALLKANAPIAKTLRPAREESVDFDTTKNLFIEGDNLDALKLLQETYLGKVKMIYIDPPYNTGNDFIYEDDFAENSGEYLRRSNQVDSEGNRLVINSAVNGRFHSDWLGMMFSRLKLARNLLREDGVIFVSIDDNEASNLKLVCDQVFGEENHLVTMYIQVRFPGKTLAEKNDYQKLIEQVLVYQRGSFVPSKESEDYSIDGFCWAIRELAAGRREVIGGRAVDIFLPGEYEIAKVAPAVGALKETWATGSVLKVNASGKYFGTHLAPRKSTDGLGVLYKVEDVGEDGLGYRYFTGPQRESATKGKFFSGVPLVRQKELSEGASLKMKPILNFHDFADAFGNCRHEGSVDFRSGKKPIEFLKKLMKMSLKPHDSDLVLDFFAGSSSTAHAVLSLNAEDDGNRRYIMVQLPEQCGLADDSDAPGFRNIADLSKERIRRAGKQIKQNSPQVDTGFRVLKIDTSNMADVYYAPDALDKANLDLFVDNIKPDRTAEDLLFQVMLDWGVDLALPIEKKAIQGKDVFFVDGNALAACFDAHGGVDEAFVKELATHKPLRVVFRDAGFKDSAIKINVEQIFKLLSPSTEVKSI
jgi:adenine-specific DNA-methyltransferase